MAGVQGLHKKPQYNVAFVTPNTTTTEGLGRVGGGSETVDSARAGDVRAATPYFLSTRRLSAFLRRLASVAVLVALDLGGVALGLYTALVIRELAVGHRPPLWGLLWEAEASWLPFLTLITALVFWRGGLYAPRERRAGFGRIVSSVVLVGALTLAFAIGSGHEFSSYLLAPTAIVLTACFVGLLRLSYETLSGDALRLAGVRRRVLLVGSGEEAERLGRGLGSSRAGIDLDIVGIASEPGEVRARLAAGPLDELVIGDSTFGERDLLEIAEEAHRRGVAVRIAPKTTEILTERVEYIPGQAVPLFELRPPVLAGTDWVVKRAFDLAVSVAVLVAGLPLWALIALAVKTTSSGPVLYRDRRVGVSEREFGMLKFRTMYGDAAELQAELERVNEADGALFKLRRDPRVTRVGRLLRRFSLDEIPQLLNVLRGEMSLVGPRPLPLRDYRRLEDWHRKRYLVLPGMTGLWQVSGRSDLGFDELVRLDFYYLENWSLGLDVSILLKTIPAVFARKGAY
jgi:exopolysaccharide biosynthesis polyprenyl glycosylphosphotransferase